jgi:hypothetical protein
MAGLVVERDVALLFVVDTRREFIEGNIVVLPRRVLMINILRSNDV